MAPAATSSPSTGGLALGNSTDLNISSTDPRQNPRQFQAYSRYVMPGGLVESFIDDVEGGSVTPDRRAVAGTRPMSRRVPCLRPRSGHLVTDGPRRRAGRDPSPGPPAW
ncbi:glycoside hydrolase family 68 protein [Micromonospora aurantiaca (nom. illeg.)]|uniref:glycoside hydrolase family 68 protein n=1 Tax=Micromonospora aurantiaca (nom. illeg.) TaxID=47850 RepID=UPI0033C511CD